MAMGETRLADAQEDHAAIAAAGLSGVYSVTNTWRGSATFSPGRQPSQAQGPAGNTAETLS
jgi:hypothetical protein